MDDDIGMEIAVEGVELPAIAGSQPSAEQAFISRIHAPIITDS